MLEVREWSYPAVVLGAWVLATVYTLSLFRLV
jgi:hypothetical protein